VFRLSNFEEFVNSRGPALLRFAYVLTGDAHRAEDLVQGGVGSRICTLADNRPLRRARGPRTQGIAHAVPVLAAPAFQTNARCHYARRAVIPRPFAGERVGHRGRLPFSPNGNYAVCSVALTVRSCCRVQAAVGSSTSIGSGSRTRSPPAASVVFETALHLALTGSSPARTAPTVQLRGAEPPRHPPWPTLSTVGSCLGDAHWKD
jgi:hypothetical protein